MGRPWRGFCARHAEEFLPCLPHPSHDSQLSRLAIAITIPVTHAAKTENSRRSLRRKAILASPSASPCRTHPDTPWDCPWSDTRHRGKNLQAIDVKTLAGVRRETVELDLVDPAGAGRGAISG